MAYERLKDLYKNMIEIKNMHANADGRMPVSPIDFRVDRQTVLGNPFPMDRAAINLEYLTRQPSANRMQVLNDYKAWFDANSANPEQKTYLDSMLDSLRKNGHLNLWDWCAPMPCHAETIGNWLGDARLAELPGKMQVANGDLMQATQPLVMQQANNMGVMGAGIAKLIRNDMPSAAFMDYRNGVLADPQGSLGMVYPARSLSDPNRLYLNVIGQDGYGFDGNRYTDYDALAMAFDKIARRFTGRELAMPYGMGAGLGGGDWSKIEDLVNEHLAPYMNVTAYKLK